MSKTICLIPGDGIGPEVAAATRRIIDATGVGITWMELPAGAAALETHGDVLPDFTINALREHKVGLKGPVTTPIGSGFTSVNVGMRRKLDLYAAVRPVRTIDGVFSRYEDVSLVVVRENTEGLYSGIENEITPNVVTSLKVVTRKASERIARYAFQYAKSRGRKRVTAFHKANIMKLSDGLFLDAVRQVHAEEAPEITYDELIIDNACMQLVRDPAAFDVVVMENLYGDIVSDLCAGLVGGLGVVPGANIGEDCMVFEAVHGSAPDIAGQGIANPLALLMSGVMMLNNIGLEPYAERIKAAYNAVLAEGNPAERTRDIGGTASTEAFADAVIARL